MPYKKYCIITVKTQKQPRVLLLGHTGISAVSIGGTTIYSGLGIKSGTKLLGLNDNSKDALKNRLSEVKFLIIDELSMVSSDLWTDIDSRLGEIFMMICEKSIFWSFSYDCADLLELPPVRRKLIFSGFYDKDSMKHLLGIQFWHLFEYGELTKVVRQNDKLIIDLTKFKSVKLMVMLKGYSRKDLYMNLMKTIQKMPSTCTHRMNML